MSLDTSIACAELNPFGGRIRGKAPEEEQEVHIVRDDAVGRMIQKHNHFLKSSEEDFHFDEATDVLTPSQIANLIMLMQREDPKIFNYSKFGLYPGGKFLSQLLQLSYNRGFNEFTLPLGDSRIDHLCTGLKGRSKTPLEVSIQGKAEYRFGAGSKYTLLRIYGDAGQNLGVYAHNSIFHVYGSVGDLCGASAVECIFYIHEDVRGEIGYLRDNHTFMIHNTFYLGGTVDTISKDAHSCRFITPYRKVFDHIVECLGDSLTREHGKNEVILEQWQQQQH